MSVHAMNEAAPITAISFVCITMAVSVIYVPHSVWQLDVEKKERETVNMIYILRVYFTVTMSVLFLVLLCQNFKYTECMT